MTGEVLYRIAWIRGCFVEMISSEVQKMSNLVSHNLILIKTPKKQQWLHQHFLVITEAASPESASQLSGIVEKASSANEKTYWRRRLLRHFKLTSPRRFIGLYTDFGTSCRVAVKCIINSKTVRIVLIWVKPVSTLWVCFVRFGANIRKRKCVWLYSTRATHEESQHPFRTVLHRVWWRAEWTLSIKSWYGLWSKLWNPPVGLIDVVLITSQDIV